MFLGNVQTVNIYSMHSNYSRELSLAYELVGIIPFDASKVCQES